MINLAVMFFTIALIYLGTGLLERRIRRAQGRRAFASGLCPACRYDLRMLTEGRCPECGEDLAQWRTSA